MKIFFPVEVFYPSQAGGPANTVYWLAKSLAEQGHSPVIVSSNKGIRSGAVTLGRWSETEAGRVIFIRTRFLHVPVRQTAVALRNVVRADVVHLSSVFYPAAFITGFAAKILGKKIAWSPRGELAEYALNYSKRRKQPILWCVKKFIGSEPLFHSTSDEESESIRKVFGRTVRVVQIPNYIEFAAPERRMPDRYLLYIGRFHPKKGLENLFEAAARSKVFRESGYELRVAGRGKPEYESLLKELVARLGMSNRIKFTGHVEGAEKNRLLASAHFTVMPSHNENFGIVVVESLAQGTPVIASTHTPWEILETERAGYWVDNSPDSLADALDRAIALEGSVYEGYRERGRELALRNFDIRNHVEEWLKFYELAAGGPSSQYSAHMASNTRVTENDLADGL